MGDEALGDKPDGSEVVSPADSGADALAVVGQPVWRLIFEDPLLSRPPSPGSPGNVPAGDDLRLDIGWDRFEQLLVFVAQGVLGLNQVRFRRYGVSGQAQHGIDLAGRRPDGAYTVVQCKQYETFDAADLRAAVAKFTEGKRPFGAKHLIVAVSTIARTIQIENELARLQDENPDENIELWGAEQINDVLRERADIVSRFWTRETAGTFCTGAPLPGVAVAAPNWIRVADQILLSPLGVDGLDEHLAAADNLRSEHPAAAAAAYHRLADTLAGDGYTGHAHVLRRKQLDALADAGEFDAATAVAAQLAATALHEADLEQARMLSYVLGELVNRRPQKTMTNVAESAAATAPEIVQASAATARHSELITAAVDAASHQLADATALMRALRSAPADLPQPAYYPLLVLLLGELTLGDVIINPRDQPAAAAAVDTTTDPAGSRLAELDDLITSALTRPPTASSATLDKDVMLRLNLLRATYNAEERTNLLTLARQLRLPRPHAALVLAAQARREAMDGSAAEAVEHWRQAVAHAIHETRTDDAAGWLYAIRAVNVYYGPWTDRMDEEHLLAQALPKTGSGRLIRRVRDPETDARRAALNNRPIEAIRAARRWLVDSIVIGDWGDEEAAAELLGDLYARNAEPDRAANCYQWAGESKKLTKLAGEVGDHCLSRAAIGSGPWQQQMASLAAAAVQHDLVDDETAAGLLRTLLDLVTRGRAGELVDSFQRSLTLQATKTACVLAARGTSEDAQALLDLLGGDVERAENHYQFHDDQHVQACLAIAAHHPSLAWPAIVRIFDLAEIGTHEALNALRRRRLLDVLREPIQGQGNQSGGRPGPPRPSPLTIEQRRLLRERLRAMASAGRYEAGLAVSELGQVDQAATERAISARDRLLDRPEPDGHSHAFGTTMVSDSYLITFVSHADQRLCLDKMLTIAADPGEAAANRQDALTAASNLVQMLSDDVRADVHARSRPFVDGDQDGSFMEAETTRPHPLSAMQIDLGPASLRGAGLRLAQCSAVTHDDRIWVRDRAVAMLNADEKSLVHASAATLYRLGPDVIGDMDAALLVGHPHRAVRELAASIAAAAPVKYAQALRALASDPHWIVRTQLAERLHDALTDLGGSATDPGEPNQIDEDPRHAARAVITEVLGELSTDVRHTVRRAAAGLRS